MRLILTEQQPLFRTSQSRIFADIGETIGNTPHVRLQRLSPSGVEIFAKLESFNPGGSVKDRMALNIIKSAEADGSLQPGQTIIEATSGNTGIALAMVCAQRGYPFVAVMVESFSIERRKLMRFLGAKVVLTPASERGTGMLAKAIELAKKHGWFLPRQFENEANAEAHSKTTAQEIIADFSGCGLDYWVTGVGTGGTLKGTARVLKKAFPKIKIAVAEPDNVPMISSGKEAAHNADGSLRVPHPAFRPHLMQGWSPDFLPELAEGAMDLGLIDQVVPVAGNDALQASRDLAVKEGILAGISGGATLAAAFTIAKTAPKGSCILCMLPDTGERYLSTALFADVPANMTKEEWAISKSTPNYRFDSQGPASAPAPATVAAPQDPTDWARKFVANAIEDSNRPVTMFALEWCEFSGSARRMFKHFDIPFHSVDLDSKTYQEKAPDIRLALAERTNIKTIPQIFIDGQLIGGCTEVFDAWREGKLQPLLKKVGIAYRSDLREDPYGFFPNWLHPRSE